MAEHEGQDMTDDQGTTTATATLDLQPFCSTDECRYYLMKPFSCEGFTWATDGSILVRVALRTEAHEIEQKINISAPIKGIDGAAFIKPSFNLPPAPSKIGDCPVCSGRGHLHDCPDCECHCESCNATGRMDKEALISTRLGPKFFSLKYIRQILALPNVEVEAPQSNPDERPMLFRFDGGVGALMSLRGARDTHIEIEPNKS